MPTPDRAERLLLMWGKVDDQLHSHPKWLEVSLAARGLWTTCLSWTCGHGTDGFVPRSFVRMHAGADADALAGELAGIGLWDEEEGGWRFHDFLIYNPSAEEAESHEAHVSAVRAEAGRRSGEARRNKARTNAEQNTNKNEPRPRPRPRPIDTSPKPPTAPEPDADGSGEERPATSDQASTWPIAVQEALAKCPPHWEPELRLLLETTELRSTPAQFALAMIRKWRRGENPPPEPAAPTPPPPDRGALRPAPPTLRPIRSDAPILTMSEESRRRFLGEEVPPCNPC